MKNSFSISIDLYNSTLIIESNTFKIERDPFQNSWMIRFKSNSQVWFIRNDLVEEIFEIYDFQYFSDEIEFLEFEYEEWEED